MRINQNTRIDGNKAILVPYRREHVLKYHQWMQDPFLQETTASEPLSEVEEFDMQKSWAEDSLKCTFIVLNKLLVTPAAAPPFLEAMVGDVNLFLNDAEDEAAAEIEVMVAEATSRERGIGKEALQLMMVYAATKLGIRTFRAKIGFKNAASRQLFHKLGFTEVGCSDVFQQVTTELLIRSAAMDEIFRNNGELNITEYDVT